MSADENAPPDRTRVRTAPPPARRAATLTAGLLLVVMTGAAYLPVRQAGFIWDDDAYVTANRTLRSLDGLRQIWFEPGAVPQYYPLTFTTLWLEQHLWGMQPLGYHLVNVFLHACNALLVWRVLRRLGLRAAWVAAAVFALHPMHVESVAWVTELKNVLSGLFVLSALLLYLRHAPPAGAVREPRVHWPGYLAVCGLYLGALLSKSVTCMLPVVLVPLMWWRDGVLDRRTLARLAPLFALGGIMATMTVWMEHHHVGAEGDEWSLSFVARGLVAGRAFWFYPRTLLWPQGLTFIYPRWVIDAHLWWQYLFPVAAVTVLLLLYLARRRLGSGPLVAFLCYGGALVPALGFFNVYQMRYSFVADHFAYRASIPLIALATAAAAHLIRHTGRARRFVGVATCAAVLLGLGVLTARQCGIYRDLQTLWTDTLAKNPQCWMAHNNFGLVLAGQGNRDEAVAHYLQALRWKPTFPEASNNLGVTLADQEKYPEAVARFQQAIRWRPDYADAQSSLGGALAMRGNTGDAIDHLEQALHLKPNYAEAYSNLGNVLVAQGRPEDAIASYTEALRLQPTNADIHNNLGMALMAQGHTNDAIAQFQEALRSNPGSVQARNNLNEALQRRGRATDAGAPEYSGS